MGKENSSENKDAWHFKLPKLSWLMSRMEGMRSTWEPQEQHVHTAAIVVFACLCLALLCKKKWAGKGRRVKPVYYRSLSMAALHGGKMAMKRIMDSQHAQVDASVLVKAKDQFKNLVLQDHPDFKQLQSAAAKLEMSGMEDEAMKMLSDAWKMANEKHQHHEAHELEMLLVEMLLFQGKYEDALKRECLQDRDISDARGPLYMAVIHAMFEDSGEAENNLKEFNEIRRQMQVSFCDTDDLRCDCEEACDYKKFEKTVNRLKQEIENARKKTH